MCSPSAAPFRAGNAHLELYEDEMKRPLTAVTAAMATVVNPSLAAMVRPTHQ